MKNKFTADHINLFIAALSYSTLGIFIGVLNDNDTDIFWQVFLRLMFACIFGFLIAKLYFKINLRITFKEFGYIFLNSLLFVFGFITISLSIYYGTPVAKAIALAFSYPLTVVVMSYWLMNEKPKYKNIISIMISLIAVCFILEIWKIEGITSIAKGDIFALSNSLAYGTIIVFGGRIRKDLKIEPIKTLSYTVLLALPEIIIIGILAGFFNIDVLSITSLTNFNLESWLSVMGLGLFGTVISSTLIYKSVKKVSTNTASIILLTELVWVMILSALVFGEAITFPKMIGASLLMISILLI